MKVSVFKGHQELSCLLLIQRNHESFLSYVKSTFKRICKKRTCYQVQFFMGNIVIDNINVEKEK